MRPRCSIIIRAFNEEKHIGKLLSGILRQTLAEAEIILVDSGSTDATVSIASTFRVSVVHISPEDFTFGRALNVGCEHATADLLVFASAHVYPVYPDWLEHLLRPFQDPQVALVYGKQRGNRLTKFSEAQNFAKLFPELSVPRQHTPLCNNANAAVRRYLWQQRKYDEQLPALEDLDWATWALSQGYFLAYAAEAEVVHVHEDTPRQVYDRYRREAIGLKRIMPAERLYLLKSAWLYLSNVASDLWHAIRHGALRAAFWEIVWFRFMQFWGTYRGFAYTGPVTRQLIQTFYYPRALRSTVVGPGREVMPIDYGSAAGEGEKLVEG